MAEVLVAISPRAVLRAIIDETTMLTGEAGHDEQPDACPSRHCGKGRIGRLLIPDERFDHGRAPSFG